MSAPPRRRFARTGTHAVAGSPPRTSCRFRCANLPVTGFRVSATRHEENHPDRQLLLFPGSCDCCLWVKCLAKRSNSPIQAAVLGGQSWGEGRIEPECSDRPPALRHHSFPRTEGMPPRQRLPGGASKSLELQKPERLVGMCPKKPIQCSKPERRTQAKR